MQEVALTTSESDSADREVLLELNRNYVRSALESDVRWYSENLSEDFYITAQMELPNLGMKRIWVPWSRERAAPD